MPADRLITDLIEAVGEGNVLWDEYDLRLYEYDGSIDKALPQAVVLPESTAQAVAMLAVTLLGCLLSVLDTRKKQAS